MLSGPKTYIRIIFRILFVAVFVIGSINSLSGSNSGVRRADIKLLETDKGPDTSQIPGNLYRNTKYHFRIEFPEGREIGPGTGIHGVQKSSFEGCAVSVLVHHFDLEGESGFYFSSIKDVYTLGGFVDVAVLGTATYNLPIENRQLWRNKN